MNPQLHLPGSSRRALRYPRSWLRRPEIALIATFLLAGAILRPVVGMAPDPIAVAPQYARSAVTVYYTLRDVDYLVPVARRVEEDGTSPRHAALELLAGPEAGPDLASPFAAGARLSDYRTSGDRVSVDLITGALDGIESSRAIDALVLTLTEFPEITAVSVSLAGEDLDANGAVVESPEFLSRPTVNPESPEASGGGGTELYFVYDAQDRYLVPVTRATPLSGRAPAMAMAELLEGPMPGSGLEPVLPGDVSVLGTRVQDGLATVNFDSHLVYAYRLSKANAMFVRRAVMATLTGLPGISAGLIEIDGSRLLLYTCVNVTQEFPQARPWAINDEFYLTTLDPIDAAQA